MTRLQCLIENMDNHSMKDWIPACKGSLQALSLAHLGGSGESVFVSWICWGAGWLGDMGISKCVFTPCEFKSDSNENHLTCA